MKGDRLFKTRHLVALTRKDGEAFSEALRQTFPRIQFLRADYTEPWIDEEASRERLRLRNAGVLPSETPWKVMRNPGRDPLRYMSSLGDAVYEAIAWVEPQGWRPRWSAAPNGEGIYTIINKPKLHFRFTRSRYVLWPEPCAFDEPPEVIPEGQILRLDCDRLWAGYKRHDKEQQAFLRKVWRILDKVTTRAIAYCDLNSVKVRGISNVRDVWVGFDALEWMRRDPRHYISDGGLLYRPPEDAPPPG